MRILFILENYHPNIGGVETLFKSLAESLVKNSFEVTVLTNKFDASLKTEEILKGVQIRRLNLKNRYLFTFFAGFKAIQFANKADIIHTTSYNAALPAFIASIFSRKKLIITFHEVWSGLWFRLPFMNKFSLLLHFLFEAFILRLPYHKFIAVSESTKRSLIDQGIKESKIEMIYNGIDYSEFETVKTPHQNEVYQFCYFGRLGISKGLDLILDAIKILKEEKQLFKFILIVPKSPSGFLTTIKKRIRKYKIEEFIDMKHELSFADLKKVVSRSDAVVIPSYSEGFCYSAVETVALEVAVISSAQAALKEVVTGKYLNMSDLTANSLVDCMKRALNNDWDYTERRQFHLSDSINSYIQLYRSLNQE